MLKPYLRTVGRISAVWRKNTVMVAARLNSPSTMTNALRDLSSAATQHSKPP